MSDSVLPRTISGGRGRLLALLVGNGLGQAAAAVATALLIEAGFDELLASGSGDATGVARVGGGLALATLCMALLRMRERVDAERLGQHYVHELRLVLFRRLTATAPRALARRSRGGVVLRFVSDLTALRQWVSLGLARLVVAGTMVVGTLGALARLSPPLAAVIGGVLSVGAALASAQGSRLRAATAEARRRRSHLAANVNEKVASVAVVQAFGQQERERRGVDRQSSRLRNAMVDRARCLGRLRAITEATAATTLTAVLVAGVALRLPVGTVAAAMAIASVLASPLRDLGRVQEYWHAGRVARAKIVEFLRGPGVVRERPGAAALEPGPGRLEFRDVRVADVLGGVAAVAEPGQVVAVVGPNGSGKSTLLALAARLVDPDEGQVLLDGQDLAGRTLRSVRRAVGLAGPDLPLLRGTVERNLRYRCPSAPPEELARVRALCDLDGLLDALPKGARTRVSESGVGLSTGQRQRIELARALLGNPAVLLLDEVDANLDSRAAAVVERVLSEYRGTVLLVTHRLDRVAAADIVWHLADGRLVEAGPPQQVLADTGPTARLFGTTP